MSEYLALERLRQWHAETAIILGSGLESLVGDVSGDRVISYSEFDELPRPTIPGHAGRFVLAEIRERPVIYAQGRVHLYEGHPAKDVVACVRVLASSGVKQLLLTNAAGTANTNFPPGSWMMINDQINLTGTTPLVETSRCDVRDAAARRPYQHAPQFVDLTDAYSPRLRENFRRAAREISMVLHEGVYAGLLGPQYETAAEVRMLQQLGADAIGMSTVLEVIQVRALGLEVAGFSCLTNWAAGIGTGKLSHAGFLETGKAAAKTFANLLQAAL
jgi:purine-nucleoside phosphorylase